MRSPYPQAHQSNRVCNALALLQCVASHPETRTAFLQGMFSYLVRIYRVVITLQWLLFSTADINASIYHVAAHIPLFLYPFLHTVSKTRPFEYLRLTSLGVIGALVKVTQTLALTRLPV
mgnify:CR=1 FL=1